MDFVLATKNSLFSWYSLTDTVLSVVDCHIRHFKYAGNPSSCFLFIRFSCFCWFSVLFPCVGYSQFCVFPTMLVVVSCLQCGRLSCPLCLSLPRPLCLRDVFASVSLPLYPSVLSPSLVYMFPLVSRSMSSPSVMCSPQPSPSLYLFLSMSVSHLPFLFP